MTAGQRLEATAAQALYRSHGYWITGFVMRKPLRRPEA